MLSKGIRYQCSGHSKACRVQHFYSPRSTAIHLMSLQVVGLPEWRTADELSSQNMLPLSTARAFLANCCLPSSARDSRRKIGEPICHPLVCPHRECRQTVHFLPTSCENTVVRHIYHLRASAQRLSAHSAHQRLPRFNTARRSEGQAAAQLLELSSSFLKVFCTVERGKLPSHTEISGSSMCEKQNAARLSCCSCHAIPELEPLRDCRMQLQVGSACKRK